MLILAAHVEHNHTKLPNKKGVILSIARLLKKNAAAFIVMIGDWNLLHHEDGRLNYHNMTFAPCRDLEFTTFANVFGHYAMLQPEEFTWRSYENGRLKLLATLDRAYVNVDSAFIDDWKPSISALGAATSSGTPSDHLPVVLRLPVLRKEPPPDISPIQPWICLHPAFKEAALTLFHQSIKFTQVKDIWQELDLLKECMHASAHQVNIALRTKGAKTDEERLHYLLIIFRSLRRADFNAILRAGKALDDRDRFIKKCEDEVIVNRNSCGGNPNHQN